MSSIALFENTCQRLEATTKRKEKEAILSEALKDPQVTTLFRYALDPYKMFFVTLPENGQSNTPTFEETISLLDSLSKREITGGEAKSKAHALLGGKWLRRLLNKNLKIGAGETTFNKIVPGLIPTFELMLAEPIKLEKGEFWANLVSYLEDYKEWWVQPKYDGWRCILVIRSGKAFLYSRQGKPLANTQLIEEAALKIFTQDIVLDGELLWTDEDGSMSYKKTSEILGADVEPPPLEDIERLKFYAFDTISITEWDSNVFSTPFIKRFEVLQSYISSRKLPPFMEPEEQTEAYRKELFRLTDQASAFNYIKEVPTERLDLTSERQIHLHLEQGFEGTILRYGLKCYELKRSKWTAKWKQFFDCVLTVVGAYEGKDSNLGRLGGFNCRGEYVPKPDSKLGYEIIPDTGQVIAPENLVEADVGGGYKSKKGSERDKFWEIRDKIVSERWILEAKYQELTRSATSPGWSLRFNPFRRFRSDMK